VSYEYETLWLFIDQTLQDSIGVRDTIECLLTDKNGKWLGRGNGPLRHISFSYKKDIALDTAKQSQFCIVHAMQDLQLKGVEKIGLKIY
jgi:gliding motility-associated lipoprotein GldH